MQSVIPEDLGEGDDQDIAIQQKIVEFLQREGIPLTYNPDLKSEGRHRLGRGIEISPRIQGRLKTHTLIHEVSHNRHRHFGLVMTAHFSDPHEREVEAEASTFLAFNHIGIDSSSFSFPSIASGLLSCHALGGPKPVKLLQQSRDRIIEVGTKIGEIIA